MKRDKGAAFDLKAAREVRQLSQSEVAEILCSTQASVSRWESAGDLPPIYRKAWLLHWKLEDLSNDGRSNKGSKRSVRRSGKAGESAKGTSGRKRKTRKAIQHGAADVPVSVQTDAQ